jgi:hypothetical protein
MLKQQSKVRRKVLNPSWRNTSSVDFVAISAKMIPHLRSAKHMTTTAKETRAKQVSRRSKASRIARLSGEKAPLNATKLRSGRRSLMPQVCSLACRLRVVTRRSRWSRWYNGLQACLWKGWLSIWQILQSQQMRSRPLVSSGTCVEEKDQLSLSRP